MADRFGALSPELAQWWRQQPLFFVATAPSGGDGHVNLSPKGYEQATTIVTSNLAFDEWDQAFTTNQLLASASLDRLRHNAYCLELDGPSYRDPKVPPTGRKTVQKPAAKTAK